MVTRRIVEVSTLLVRMFDHLIVSYERHYSFLDAGELGNRAQVAGAATMVAQPQVLSARRSQPG